MRDAEASRSRTHLLLENKKQNTFASENNLKSTRVLESTKIKDSGIHKRNNGQNFEFLLKNVYKFKGLFMGSIKLDRQ